MPAFFRASASFGNLFAVLSDVVAVCGVGKGFYLLETVTRVKIIV